MCICQGRLHLWQNSCNNLDLLPHYIYDNIWQIRLPLLQTPSSIEYLQSISSSDGGAENSRLRTDITSVHMKMCHDLCNITECAADWFLEFKTFNYINHGIFSLHYHDVLSTMRSNKGLLLHILNPMTGFCGRGSFEYKAQMCEGTGQGQACTCKRALW